MCVAWADVCDWGVERGFLQLSLLTPLSIISGTERPLFLKIMPLSVPYFLACQCGFAGLKEIILGNNPQ